MKDPVRHHPTGLPCRPEKFRRLSRAGHAAADAAAMPSLTVHRLAGVGASTPRPTIASAPAGASILFCAAPSACSGTDGLTRLQQLAQRLGVRPQVLLRGTAATARTVRALGWTVIDATPDAILRLQPDLAVIDDSSPTLVALWVRLARLFEIPVARIRDLAVRSAPARDDLAELPGWIANDSDLGGAPIDTAMLRDKSEGAGRAPGRTLIALPGGGRSRRIHPFTHSPIHSFTHSPIHSFTHSPIHPFTHSPIHAFTHSPIHAFTHFEESRQ
jgi:hypothetical protein